MGKLTDRSANQITKHFLAKKRIFRDIEKGLAEQALVPYYKIRYPYSKSKGNLKMPRVQVSKAAKSLASRPSVIEKGIDDKFNLIHAELTPDGVRTRLQAAARGQIGGLQMIYSIMESEDARYSGILRSLKADIAGCPIKIFKSEKKSRDSNLAYKLIKEQYRRINNVNLLKQLVKPYYRGLAVWEKMWEMQSSLDAGGRDLAFFTGLRPVPGTRLVMFVDPMEDTYGKIGIVSQEHPMGRPVDSYERGALLFSDEGDIEPGNHDMAGTARACLSWFLAKMYTRTFWAQLNEDFGTPTEVAYVPIEKKKEERKKLEHYLRFLSRNRYGIFDEDVEIELHNALSNGNITTHRELIGMANDEMTIATVGQVQTSDGGDKGSYAKAAVHFRVLRSLKIMIAAMAEEEIYDINLDFCRFNIDEDFDPEYLPRVAPIVPRPEDRETTARFFDIATRYVDVPVRQIREELELEEQQDGEETIGPESRRPAAGDLGSGESDSSSSSSGEDRKPNSVGEQEDNRKETE